MKSNDDKDTKNVAGFCIFRVSDTAPPQILGLRLYGKFDLPKGHIKKGEDPLKAAFREAEEEAGYKKSDLFVMTEKTSFYDENKKKNLYVFLAATDKDPTISWEHHGFTWINENDAKIQNFYDYLKPAVAWAFEKMRN